MKIHFSNAYLRFKRDVMHVGVDGIFYLKIERQNDGKLKLYGIQGTPYEKIEIYLKESDIEIAASEVAPALLQNETFVSILNEKRKMVEKKEAENKIDVSQANRVQQLSWQLEQIRKTDKLELRQRIFDAVNNDAKRAKKKETVNVELSLLAEIISLIRGNRQEKRIDRIEDYCVRALANPKLEIRQWLHYLYLDEEFGLIGSNGHVLFFGKQGPFAVDTGKFYDGKTKQVVEYKMPPNTRTNDEPLPREFMHEIGLNKLKKFRKKCVRINIGDMNHIYPSTARHQALIEMDGETFSAQYVRLAFAGHLEADVRMAKHVLYVSPMEGLNAIIMPLRK